MTDRITNALCAEIRSRADVGFHKYKVRLGDAPLSSRQVLQHLKEELLDAAAYIQKMIDMEDQNKGTPTNA